MKDILFSMNPKVQLTNLQPRKAGLLPLGGPLYVFFFLIRRGSIMCGVGFTKFGFRRTCFGHFHTVEERKDRNALKGTGWNNLTAKWGTQSFRKFPAMLVD